MSKQIIYLGTNGTGKTFSALTIANEVAKHRPVIICHKGIEQKFDNIPYINIKDRKLTAKLKKGIFAVEPSEYAYRRDEIIRHEDPNKEDKTKEVSKNVFTYILENLYDALVIFDDSKNYIFRREIEEINRLLRNRRQRMLDFIFMFHSVDDVPSIFWNNSTDIIMFNVNSDIPSSITGDKRQMLNEMRRIVKQNINQNKHYASHFDMTTNQFVKY